MTTKATSINTLLKLAMQACDNAYAPYSDFPVGAALATSNQEYFAGCNVENACYNLGSCAERNAIAHAISHLGYPLNIETLLIYTPKLVSISPCGGCRQAIKEFMSDNALVLAYNPSGHIHTWKVQALLPDSFSL